MHGIYKYVSDGKIIYIGKTDNSLCSRISSHAKEDKFKNYPLAKIYYFLTSNKTETTVYEKLLINKYQPILNVADTHDISMEIKFEEPDWIPYSDTNYNIEKNREAKRKEREAKRNERERKKNRRIKDLETICLSLQDDLFFLKREIWLVDIFNEIVESDKTEKIVTIPDKYFMNGILASDQFIKKESILYNLSWIPDSMRIRYDICSRNAQEYNHFKFEYIGYRQYRFYIEKVSGLNEFYHRCLDGYRWYTQYRINNLHKRLNAFADMQKTLLKSL